MIVKYDSDKQLRIVKLDFGAIAAISMPDDPDDPSDDGVLLCTFEQLSDIEHFLAGFFDEKS